MKSVSLILLLVCVLMASVFASTFSEGYADMLSEADEFDMDDEADDDDMGVSLVDTEADAQGTCAYTCQFFSGKLTPVQRRGFVPTANGCGAKGTSYLSESFNRFLGKLASPREMTKCCSEHDICYGTCGKTKAKCDKDFGECMSRFVRLAKFKSTRSMAETRCIDLRLDTVFYQAVDTLGCSAYITAQKDACVCRGEVKLPFTWEREAAEKKAAAKEKTV